MQDVVAHGAAGKAHHLGQSVQRYFLLLARATQLHLHLALFQAALAHDDLHGPADEVGVVELHAGALVTVVDDHLEAELGQILRDFLGHGLHLVVATTQIWAGATESGHMMPCSS